MRCLLFRSRKKSQHSKARERARAIETNHVKCDLYLFTKSKKKNVEPFGFEFLTLFIANWRRELLSVSWAFFITPSDCIPWKLKLLAILKWWGASILCVTIVQTRHECLDTWNCFSASSSTAVCKINFCKFTAKNIFIYRARCLLLVQCVCDS